jgi:hypothetical protein
MELNKCMFDLYKLITDALYAFQLAIVCETAHKFEQIKRPLVYSWFERRNLCRFHCRDQEFCMQIIHLDCTRVNPTQVSVSMVKPNLE